MAEWLISKGADLDAAKQNNWLTPLFLAGISEKRDLAELLINRGANVSTRDNELKTPLHYASMYGHTAVAQLLIEKGADVLAETKYGWTPLLYATQAGNKNMMESTYVSLL